MGKIDDLRKQREQRFAEMQRRAKAHVSSADANGTAAPAPHRADSPSAAPVSPEPVNEEKSSPAVGPERGGRPKKSQLRPKSSRLSKSDPRADASLQGKCRACGKVKALANGLLVNHQKGLGKPCPGSRKKPSGA